MATACIIAIIIVICIFSVYSYIKKLKNGCCGAGGDNTDRIASKPLESEKYKHKFTVIITGMTCKNCSVRIANRFNRQDGIHAEVSHKDGKAEIYSLTPLEELIIKQIIIGLGYGIESINMEY